MYKNLIIECKRKGVTRDQIANLWGVRYNTVGEKLNGKTRIYLDEAMSLHRVFFPEFKLEYLFYHTNSQQTNNGECEKKNQTSKLVIK